MSSEWGGAPVAMVVADGTADAAKIRRKPLGILVQFMQLKHRGDFLGLGNFFSLHRFQ